MNILPLLSIPKNLLRWTDIISCVILYMICFYYVPYQFSTRPVFMFPNYFTPRLYKHSFFFFSFSFIFIFTVNSCFFEAKSIMLPFVGRNASKAINFAARAGATISSSSAPSLNSVSSLSSTPSRSISSTPLFTSSPTLFASSPSTDFPANVARFTSPRASDPTKTSLMFTISHAPGSLNAVLATFSKFNVNMTRLESKPCAMNNDYEFHVDFDGTLEDPNIRALLESLRNTSRTVHILDSKKVPWFPRHKRDLDIIANDILDAGADLEADHPGFQDVEYRLRRQHHAETALSYRYGQRIPEIQYTDAERACWRAVYESLDAGHKKHACEEMLRLKPLLEKNCGFGPNNIPQLQDVSDFLQDCTGFTLRPVAGLLSTRNFLYGLAFRTFFSTQYIRHHSKPFYTPEPDIMHELMGHAALFADKNFADFSQEIGLASIGATDRQIEQLGRCFWFSVEFGLCKQNGELKAYGAGLLSSYGELEWSVGQDPSGKKPEYREWNPFNAADQSYPITTYQPIYYIAESFEQAKDRMVEFSKTLSRPFNVRYNPYTLSIEVDANVKMSEHVFKKPSTDGEKPAKMGMGM